MSEAEFPLRNGNSASEKGISFRRVILNFPRQHFLTFIEVLADCFKVEA